MRTIFQPALSISLLLVIGYGLHSCKKKSEITISAPLPEKVIDAFYNPAKVIHLYKDTVYTMSSSITRSAGQQLIIDEGTLIKVDSTAGIVINPGGRLLANGTAGNPIVFTLNAAPGTQNISWQGISIQGQSFDNASGSSGNSADSSGSLRYVRIEFSHLVLSGAGSGTTLENIQVSYSYNAPAFEFDGGSFNARNLVSYACAGPVDFYITRGYQGKLQNMLAYRLPWFGARNFTPPNALTGVFIENNPYDTSLKPYTYPVISNLTVLGPNGQQGTSAFYNDTLSRAAALITTGNARFRIRNSLLLGFPRGGWCLDDSLTGVGLTTGISEFSWSIAQSNDTSRTFYISTGTFIDPVDFKGFVLSPSLHNMLFKSADDFMLNDPFHYENAAPDPAPKSGSPVLSGADFSGADFSDVFFNKVAWKGALGNEDWIQGWINFHPLQSQYNFPR